MKPIAAILALVLVLVIVGQAEADPYSGRKGVLYLRVKAKLALNPPYMKVTSDCSFHAWDLLQQVVPEMAAYKWFRRSTANTMRNWPWQEVFTLVDATFGDLLFFKRPGRKRMTHVGLQWIRAATMAHASSSKGFVDQSLGRYWTPKLAAIKRPPY